MSIINIMDPNVGVQGVLDPTIRDVRLPQARPLSTGVSPETGLADLYRASNFQSRILEGLQPRVNDDVLLRPDVFGRNLKTSLDILQKRRDPHIRRFVRDDLGPLIENERLLRDYVNMLVSG
jgi:hypothetical protein